MKILECILCSGEIEIVDDFFSVNKKVKCQKCGYTNIEDNKQKPEVTIIRKKI